MTRVTVKRANYWLVALKMKGYFPVPKRGTKKYRAAMALKNKLRRGSVKVPPELRSLVSVRERPSSKTSQAIDYKALYEQCMLRGGGRPVRVPRMLRSRAGRDNESTKREALRKFIDLNDDEDDGLDVQIVPPRGSVPKSSRPSIVRPPVIDDDDSTTTQ